MYKLNDISVIELEGYKLIHIDTTIFDDIFAGVWSSERIDAMKEQLELLEDSKPLTNIMATLDASDILNDLLLTLIPPSNSSLHNKTALSLGLGLGLSLSADQRHMYDTGIKLLPDLGVLSSQYSADMIDKFWEMSSSIEPHVRCQLWSTYWGTQAYDKDFISLIPDDKCECLYNSLWQMSSLQEFTLKCGINTASLLGSYNTVYVGCIDINKEHRLVPIVVPNSLCGRISPDSSSIYKWLKTSKIPPYPKLADCNNAFAGSIKKILFNTLVEELNQ